jgi:hypothetical protein
MAGRGDESQAEALEVVEGVVQRVDLELAGIARSGIDLADGEAPPSFRRAARPRFAASSASAASSGAGGGSVTRPRTTFLKMSLRMLAS